MREWLGHHFLFITIVSLAAGAVGIVAAGLIAVLLPADYFVRPSSSAHGIGLARKVLKNIVGAILFLIGFVMALPLVPGPGLIFMLIGLSMTDFPGKRRLEVRLLRIPGLLGQVNRVRGIWGRGALALPGGEHDLPTMVDK
jgi:hypothetical protein